MRLAVNQNGDFVFGSSVFPVFAGYKIDVPGTARIQGNLTTNVTGNSLVKTDASGMLIAAVAGTDYQLPISNPVSGTGAAGIVG